MVLKTVIATAIAWAALGATGSAFAQAAAPDTAGIVKEVMDDTYGQTYDAKNTCWAFTWKDDQGESADYCMRASTPQVVDGPKGKLLYFHTYNATDIHGDPRYGYSQVQPGLMGAFKLRLGGKQGWTYEASEAATDYGTAGDCGCTRAQFVKLSNAGDYGWLFVSGGTWQGVSVADYSLVAAIKGRITDISKIPQVTEKAQGVTYTASVKDDPTAKGFYPLHVVKKSAGKSEAFDVPFDAAKSVYALPAGR
jgi:hypothetical protein